MTETSDDAARSSWARYLHEVTERPGWSVSRLAKEAQVHRSTIYRWLNGETSAADTDSVRRIATAVGDSPDVALAAAAEMLEGGVTDPDAQAVALIKASDLPEDVQRELIAELRRQARADAERRRQLINTALRIRHA